MTLERRKSPGEAWETVPVSNGGSQPDNETVSRTTDPNTFTHTEVFDVGAPGVVAFKFTLTAVDGDGETFGDGPGDIGVGLAYAASPDGTNWSTVNSMAQDVNHVDNNGNLSTPNQFFEVLFGTLKEGRGVLTILDDAQNPYAGPNNPTATVSLFYSVITLGSQLT